MNTYTPNGYFSNQKKKIYIYIYILLKKEREIR